METLWQDLKYGARMLARSPGFTAIALLTLALGIGANTAIFSVVNAVLLRPLPYKDPDRLMMIWEHNFKRGRDRNVISPANFLDWKSQSSSFEDMAMGASWSRNLSGGGEPEQVSASVVSDGFLAVLGVQPALGRDFRTEETRPQGPDVVLLSHGFWQRRYGGDRSVVGRTIQLAGRPHEVVGVLPQGFRFFNLEFDVWLPLQLDPTVDYRKSAGRYGVSVARLKPGVTREQAQADLASIAARLEKEHPEFNTGWGVNVVALYEVLVGDARLALLVLLGAVAFVLLIACANVANLLLARAASRQREMAIRTALGAGRARIIGQLLTESLLLSLAGGAAGWLIALWGVELLVKFTPVNFPRLTEVSLDAGVLLFTAALSILTGLIFGLAPAWQVSCSAVNESLKEGSRASAGAQHRFLRSLLATSEVALSLILLVGAALLVRSFLSLLKEKPGFNPENLLTLSINLPGAKYGTGVRQVQFFEQLTDRIAALPGVESAGAISYVPLGGPGSATSFDVLDRPLPPAGQHPTAEVRFVTRDFFRATAIPLLRGRTFDRRDDVAEPQSPAREDSAKPSPLRTVVINETLARHFWPTEDPVGKRLQMGWGEMQVAEIIGVVGDVKLVELESDPRDTIYWYHQQIPSSFMALVIRTAGDPRQLVGAVKSQVAALDSDQPVARIRPMEEIVARNVALRRYNATLLGIFSAGALLMAGIGLYGVISYSVSQRTHEIGIRMALGAQPGDVLRLVLRGGMAMTAVGVAAGLGGALALTRLMETLLFKTQATDPLAIVLVTALLAGVALVACWIPARRATRVDPMVALRHE